MTCIKKKQLCKLTIGGSGGVEADNKLGQVDIEGDSQVYSVASDVIPWKGQKKSLDIKQNKRKDYKKYKSSFYVSKITENQ